MEDVFSLFSAADIRRIRDESLGNLETLILAVISRLSILRTHPSFPSLESAPERDALNCIRILTRLLPFIYEADHLESWDERFFWGACRKRRRQRGPQRDVIFAGDSAEARQDDEGEKYQDTKPLAEELIDTLIDLLFFRNFTIPLATNAEEGVQLAIWQSGVGCNSPIGTSKECENNRLEILRLLLTLSSKSMYTPASPYNAEPRRSRLLTPRRHTACPRCASNNVHYHDIPEATRPDISLLSPQYCISPRSRPTITRANICRP